MKYKNIISLGFFCSTASELERLGLRSSSGPFDWVISDLEGILKLISNDFTGFLEIENLSQYRTQKHIYKDNKYNLRFYHDFNPYDPLADQLPKVSEKYKRRINRFYEDISEPTLFVRYIQNATELTYLNQKYKEVTELLKRFNPNNEILLVSNDDLKSEKLKIFYVEKDNNDTVARNFLKKNIKLNNFLNSEIFDSNERKANIQNFVRKNEKQKTKNKMYKKITTKFIGLTRNKYVHDKVIADYE